jgi:Flp pilus assembly protein TadG
MALVAPLLLLLLFGIIEFAVLFGQWNDVRHGAREGARYAAVNGGSATAIRDVACDSMDLSTGIGTVKVSISRTGAVLGSTGTITVTDQVQSLTHAPLISAFLPAQIHSTIQFRLEQKATWAATANMACP